MNEKGSTLLLVKVAESPNVFGAYLNIPWPKFDEPSRRAPWPNQIALFMRDHDLASFLFSLDNAFERPFRFRQRAGEPEQYLRNVAAEVLQPKGEIKLGNVTLMAQGQPTCQNGANRCDSIPVGPGYELDPNEYGRLASFNWWMEHFWQARKISLWKRWKYGPCDKTDTAISNSRAREADIDGTKAGGFRLRDTR